MGSVRGEKVVRTESLKGLGIMLGSRLPLGIGKLFRDSEHEVIIFEFRKLISAVS